MFELIRMTLLEQIHEKIAATFRRFPFRFFSEDDIHSALYLMATNLLEKEEVYERTEDNKLVGRVHHEYPTPFRCLMKGSTFEVITEAELGERRMTDPNFRARRGYLDLAVLNSQYIASNELRVVSGKRYSILKSCFKGQLHTALDLAIEVVYYPTLDRKVHKGIMKRRVQSTIQDYQKLVALMKFRHGDSIPFCKQSVMMFFSNSPHKDKLENMLNSIKTHDEVQLYKILEQS